MKKASTYTAARLCAATLVMAASLSAARSATNVYRGLMINGDGDLVMTADTFRFNPEMSLSDAQLAGLSAGGTPTHACFLKIRLEHSLQPQQSETTTDFYPFQVTFDDNPTGHYSMDPVQNTSSSKMLRDQLYMMHARAPFEFDELIVDGTHRGCFELEPVFR